MEGIFVVPYQEGTPIISWLAWPKACRTGYNLVMKNIVILISGRGSNMEAIVRTFNQEKWDARLSAVISNRADAAGLGFAEKAGIPTRVVSHNDYPDR